ncbi:TPA: bifunctional aminodeoxychorismate synthase component I/aminotransferase, partial [Campylobacter lari]|nr:bifunctional aminodeoxychorismate synthase component I/aminotransferase [Campylobacter lari]
MAFAIFGKYLYDDLAFTLKAYTQKESKKAFKAIEKYKNQYYFLGYIQYEFYKYLEDKNYKSKEPFLYFFAFKTRKI